MRPGGKAMIALQPFLASNVSCMFLVVVPFKRHKGIV
jgi:hypothetical protein